MRQKLLGAFVLLCLSVVKQAQGQVYVVRQGAVIQSGTNTRIESAAIHNKGSRGTVHTNTFGLFSILAAQGDTLEFSKIGYAYLEAVVTEALTGIYYLKPYSSKELKEIVITGSSVKNELLIAQQAYRSKSVFYTGRPHYYYLFLKPITFIYENFKGEVKQARRFKKVAKEETDAYEVGLKFNSSIIKKYTAIRDDELDNFQLAYQPTKMQVKKWTDYDMIAYIRQSFNNFRQQKDKGK
ncbi:hypothetical protein [Mucilaginibacter sp.]